MEKLTSIVAIRDYLRSYELENRASAARLEQFALDWIEEEVDRAESFLEEESGISVDDITFQGAVHYRVDTIREILSPSANCYQFFDELEQLVRIR